ncbi:MAG: hypothetical protein QXN26_03275 [Thermoplasmataceae archaeon]
MELTVRMGTEGLDDMGGISHNPKEWHGRRNLLCPLITIFENNRSNSISNNENLRFEPEHV